MKNRRNLTIKVKIMSCCPELLLADATSVAQDKEGIEDRTATNLVDLRRVIYLTIMNALNYEEAVHKLLKVQLQEGEEVWFFSFHVTVTNIALD